MTHTHWLRTLLALALVMVVGPTLFAQAIGDEAGTVTAPLITSVGAVVAFSIAATAIAKKVLVDVAFMQRIPLWAYVITFSFVFTYLGNQVFGTLEGSFGLLLWNAVFNAAAASGVREWVMNGLGTSLEKSVTGSDSRRT